MKHCDHSTKPTGSRPCANIVFTKPTFRIANKPHLRQCFVTLRQHLLAYLHKATDAQLDVPYAPTHNPPLWELAHVAWFAQWWCVRGAYNTSDGRTVALRDSDFPNADALLNSNIVPHRQRWGLCGVGTAPSAALTRTTVSRFLQSSLDDVLQALEKAPDTAEHLAPFMLSVAHEAMHLEAIAWMAHALGHPAPDWVVLDCMELPQASKQLQWPGGTLLAGTALDNAPNDFAFDNERPAQRIHCPAFEIDSQPITNGEYLAFVVDAGYARDELWPESSRAWRQRLTAMPRDWRYQDHHWQMRRFDQWIPLPLNQPVVHINAYEASAYCAYRGRRLPTEFEWEIAAKSLQINWGQQVWEWTSSAFAPYPGFIAGMYQEYSAPWFGNHTVLRGGSFATLPMMHAPQYRNFFLPDRSNVFAGFRTAITRQ